MVVWLKWLVVADVAVTLIADAADDIVSFIHAIAGSIDIIAGRGEVLSEESASLCDRRSWEARKVECCISKVEGANQLTIDSSWFPLARISKFLGDSYNKGNASPRVVKPALSAGKANAVIGPVNDDSVFVESGLLKSGDMRTHPRVHGGDEFIVAFPVFANPGSIWVIGWKSF